MAINTQKVALNALVFLYHKVLHRDLGELGFAPATKQRSPPTVLSPADVQRIIGELQGQNRLIVQLRTVQELLGHNDVNTTQIYTHVLGRHYAGTLSPLDRF